MSNMNTLVKNKGSQARQFLFLTLAPISDNNYSLECKITDHPELSTSCCSLKETLGLLLYHYCWLDATEIVLENEVQLVKAAFSRIKIFGGTARTVLEVPFVLEANFNYFREKDPSFVSFAKRAMLHSSQCLGTREHVGSHDAALFSSRHSESNCCPRGLC